LAISGIESIDPVRSGRPWNENDILLDQAKYRNTLGGHSSTQRVAGRSLGGLSRGYLPRGVRLPTTPPELVPPEGPAQRAADGGWRGLELAR
jgi:hypothetical protein